MRQRKKNITITLDADVARWVRVWSASADKSVSAMLAEVVKEKMRNDELYNKALQRYLKRESIELKNEDEKFPSREEIQREESLNSKA